MVLRASLTGPPGPDSIIFVFQLLRGAFLLSTHPPRESPPTLPLAGNCGIVEISPVVSAEAAAAVTPRECVFPVCWWLIYGQRGRANTFPLPANLFHWPVLHAQLDSHGILFRGNNYRREGDLSPY